MNNSNANHILLDLTAILLPDGATTFQKWKLSMMTYIMSTGNSYILQKDHPAKNLMD